jgi:hypothetical protein
MAILVHNTDDRLHFSAIFGIFLTYEQHQTVKIAPIYITYDHQLYTNKRYSKSQPLSSVFIAQSIQVLWQMLQQATKAEKRAKTIQV